MTDYHLLSDTRLLPGSVSSLESGGCWSTPACPVLAPAPGPTPPKGCSCPGKGEPGACTHKKKMKKRTGNNLKTEPRVMGGKGRKSRGDAGWSCKQCHPHTFPNSLSRPKITACSHCSLGTRGTSGNLVPAAVPPVSLPPQPPPLHQCHLHPHSPDPDTETSPPCNPSPGTGETG